MFKKSQKKYFIFLFMTILSYVQSNLFAQDVKLSKTAISQFTLPSNNWSGPMNFGGFINYNIVWDGCWFNNVNIYSQLDAGFNVSGHLYKYQNKVYDLDIIMQYDHRGLEGFLDIKVKSVSFVFNLNNVQFTKSTNWSKSHSTTSDYSEVLKSTLGFEFDCEKYKGEQIAPSVSSIGMTIVGINSARFENTEIVEERIKNYIKIIANKESYDKLIKQADDFFNKKDFEQAKRYYENALKILPDEKYPDQQINKIDDLLKQADDKAKRDKVESLINEGNKALNEKQNSLAKTKFEEALALDPSNTQAKTGIAKTEKEILDAQKATDAKEKSSTPDKSTSANLDKDAKEKEDKALADQKRQDEAAAEAQRQEEARIAEENRKREEEIARKKRQEEYYDRHDQQDQQNVEGMALLLAYTIGLEVKLGQFIYTEFPALSDLSVGEPNDSYKFSMKSGYSLSMNPLKPLVTEEDYDGNTYTYSDDSTMRDCFTLNLNLIYEFFPLYGKHFGYGFWVNGGIGHGLSLQEYKLSYGAGTEWYAGAEQLQIYHRLKYGGDIMGYKPWLNSRKSGGGNSNSDYIRNEIGLRLNVEGDYQSHFYFGFLFNRSRLTKYTGLFPLMKNGEKGLALRFENEFGWNLYLEVITNYLAFGENETTIASLHSSKYKSTYFNLGFLSSINAFGTNVNVLRDGFAGSKIRFRKNFISFMSPNSTILHTKTPGLDRVDKLRLGLAVGYEREIPLRYPLSATVGGQINLMKGGGVTNSEGKSFNLKYNSFDIPLGVKLYLSNYNSKAKYWFKPSLVPSINISRNIESNLNDIKDFKGVTFMTEISVGVDYMLGSRLGGRFSTFIDYGMGNLSNSGTTYLRQRVVGFKGGFIF